MTAAAPTSPPAEAGAELRRGATSVRVALGPGAPITSFVHDGREWCGPGGWQDYAPTRAACALQTFVAGAAGVRFRDGGSLLAEEPAVTVRANDAGPAITAVWEPQSYPIAWQREVAFRDDGALALRYEATNTQRAPLPFIWGLPLSIGWDEALALELPRGARARVAESHGGGLSPAGHEFTWPSLRDGGHLVDLAHPVGIGASRAALCFVELQRGRVGVRYGTSVLDVRAGADADVTHARVWVNNGYASNGMPRRWWNRRNAPSELSVGLAIGAPDLLSDAVGGWGAARWLEPGATARWSLYIQVQPVEV